MAKIKSVEMKSIQLEKLRKCRTTTKQDKDLSGVLKKFKKMELEMQLKLRWRSFWIALILKIIKII